MASCLAGVVTALREQLYLSPVYDAAAASMPSGSRAIGVHHIEVISGATHCDGNAAEVFC
jgi:hypothetical protein